MIDIKIALVSALKTATSYPVYYELVYTPGVVPAVTYKELENAALLTGDTISYSTLRYEIKLWDTSMINIITKSDAIDAALKNLGWKRYAAFEMSYNAQILKVLRYVAIGYDEV